MNNYIVIVAGGKGERMRSGIPKQFMILHNKPLLMHTIRAFDITKLFKEIILVLPETQIATWEKLCIDHNFIIKHTIVSGGETRFNSVKNGLQAIAVEEAIVAVHDGVRPLISSELITRLLKTAKEKSNAIPAVAMNDSLRVVDPKTSANKYLDRSHIRSIQTPQCFMLSKIRKAFDQPCKAEFTDEATVLETTGETINLIEGEMTNIKITTPADLQVAEILFSTKKD